MASQRGASAFNRSQKPGLIKLSTTVNCGPASYTIVPVSALDATKLKIKCERCSTRFAVIGSAFFCPSCGFNSAERIFVDAIRKVETKIDNLEAIRPALEAAADKESAELTCRSLLETSLGDCVVAFQKLMDSLCARLSSANKPPLNAFQKLVLGSTLQKRACGTGYEDVMQTEELEEMNMLFQKRHLLAHTEGFVDDKYIGNSGDTHYQIGQSIVIRDRDVRRPVELVRKLSSKIVGISNTNSIKGRVEPLFW